MAKRRMAGKCSSCTVRAFTAALPRTIRAEDLERRQLLAAAAAIFGGEIPLQAGFTPRSAIVADLSHHGGIDLINTDSAQSSITVRHFSNAGGFGFAQTFATGLHPYSVVAGDLNGDGKTDVVT